MTTKVVKGSFWTLAGQVAPLAVSLVTMPFVIRMLGAEGYGVLILIGLIPTYLGFADFGMSTASTKFASEAYAEGDEAREARIVRTAAFIALCSSIPIAAALIVFAGKLVTLFQVPDFLVDDARLALRIASITFVVNILCTIVNSPQLARLRMDLNTIVNAGARILGLLAVPVILHFGYGVVWAVSALLCASLVSLIGHILFSSSLLSGLVRKGLSSVATTRAMMRFGGHLIIAAAAAMAVANIEKLILPTQVPVEALAYYSVAFTLANMVSLFSQAMIQSLIPAFSQLQGSANREHLNNLYSRGIRLNIIVMLPVIATLIIAAEPFMRMWAGPEYATQGIIPFYILLFGLLFNLPAFLPYATILAAGRSDVFAKLYLLELVPYIFVVFFLTSQYGIVGAAAAWSIRITVDAVLQFYLARRLGGVGRPDVKFSLVAVGALILVPPLVVHRILDGQLLVTSTVLVFSLVGYLIFVWARLLDSSEIDWGKDKLRRSLRNFG